MVDSRLVNILSKMWIGRCSVIEMIEVHDPVTHVTSTQEKTVLENEPCRLSFSLATPAQPTETFTGTQLFPVLFLRPDLVIGAGSRVIVTQNERTMSFKASGVPRVYTSHQEIGLIDMEDKA